MKHLCMSYNKYIIKRKKLSNACTKNKSDSLLLDKLVNFIRQNADYELKRQTQARDATTNLSHRAMHNAKIEDLLEPAEVVYKQRIAYKSIRESETDVRTAVHDARMKSEKLNAIKTKEFKLQQARLYNINNIAMQKLETESIRLERFQKKNVLNSTNNLN